MKRAWFCVVLFSLSLAVLAEKVTVNSPDGNLSVVVDLTASGQLIYNLSYNNKVILEESPLGLITNVSDFSKNLKFIEKQTTQVDEEYLQNRIKRSYNRYQANELVAEYENSKKERISLVLRVSNNDVAFKYKLYPIGQTARCIIEQELSGFNFPTFTTTFLTPQAPPMIGWMSTKPSYEEEYVPDEPVGTPSKYGVGYTFPGLFRIGNDGWALISETGVGGLYAGSKLSEASKDGLYAIAYPEPGENNGIGLASPAISLPGETPWRTITVGDQLKPIVETTIAYDLVEPLYEASQHYKMGRSTWSWIMWQDNSINFNDQVKFIDLSAAMGYEYVLIDANWDRNIGRKKIEELAVYAASKNVEVCLWYNSNGYWSDAPMTPINYMSSALARKKEMAWMQRIGVKGIKVDFFGGDKQVTMQLYEDILSDANDYGLVVIFHGCTLPRGWERMYPNFVGSEAVLASENLIFTQHANDQEAYNATLHPFIRNSVASMDFGPVLLNKRHNRTNDGGHTRKTTDVFQIATAVLFHAPVQNFAIAPNNLTDVAPFVMDFMKEIPVEWDDIAFIDGYPGKYVVLARRNGEKWYVAGINAEKQAQQLTVNLPMLAGQTVRFYSDAKKDRSPQLEEFTVKQNGEVKLTILPEGGIVIVN